MGLESSLGFFDRVLFQAMGISIGCEAVVFMHTFLLGNPYEPHWLLSIHRSYRMILIHGIWARSDHHLRPSTLRLPPSPVFAPLLRLNIAVRSNSFCRES